MRRGLLALLAALAVLAALVVGCSSTSGSSASTTSAVPSGRVVLPGTDDTGTFDGTSAVPAALDPAALTAACEEYVPLGAFTGDVEMQALWTAVGQDAAALARRCAELADTNAAWLATMASDLAAFRAEAETTSTDVPTSANPTAGPTTAAAPVMPSLLCSPLHDALDRLAEVGVTEPLTFDATGAGRTPVVDGTWIVATQSPGAGTPVGDGRARLGVVRTGESQPC